VLSFRCACYRRSLVGCGDLTPHIGAESASLHRQAGLGSIERLDLRLLVDQQHHRMLRRVDIEPNHALDLLGEGRIVRELELPPAMRHEARLAPDDVDFRPRYARRRRHERSADLSSDLWRRRGQQAAEAPAPQVSTSSISSSWLHPLKRRSLRQTRSGSSLPRLTIWARQPRMFWFRGTPRRRAIRSARASGRLLVANPSMPAYDDICRNRGIGIRPSRNGGQAERERGILPHGGRTLREASI
jgi:hypothetical protein